MQDLMRKIKQMLKPFSYLKEIIIFIFGIIGFLFIKSKADSFKDKKIDKIDSDNDKIEGKNDILKQEIESVDKEIRESDRNISNIKKDISSIEEEGSEEPLGDFFKDRGL